MALTIDDDAGRMTSSVCDATATRQPDGRWTVTGRAGVYDRNQAITAMTLAEAYASGKTIEDPNVQSWEAELEERTKSYCTESWWRWGMPELQCGLLSDHKGSHRDIGSGEEWAQ